MAKSTSKKVRDKQAVSTKLDDHEKRINKAEEAIKELNSKQKDLTKEFKTLQKTRVIDDLSTKKPGFSNKNQFTYDEVAKRNGTSVGTVQRIANDNELTRRNLQVLKTS